jgi:hypothetical protein
MASYHILKWNAKRRDIDFGITIEEWKQFCEDTGYLELRGPDGEDMTVDRKDGTIGYIYSNLQMMTRLENIKKGQDERKRGKHWKRKFLSDVDMSDVPF